MTARYPIAFAVALSASIFWARVMRGTQSMPSTVALRAASISTTGLLMAGQMNEMSVAPSLSRSASCLPSGRSVGVRTLRMMSASSAQRVRFDHARAELGVGAVEEVGALTRSGLHEDLEAELLELLDRVRRRGDALLVRMDLFRNPDLQSGRDLSRLRPRTGRRRRARPEPRPPRGGPWPPPRGRALEPRPAPGQRRLARAGSWPSA